LRKVTYFPLCLGSVGMLVLIFDGQTAVSGVREGLQLCLNTLIPSLFPFFVLSSLITGSIMGVSTGPLRWICRFCRMPTGSESLLTVGILGGYPVGAGNIGTAYRNGAISLKDAQRLAIFCNNPGPSFLFGVLGPLFPHSGWVWLLWIIQVTATLLTGYLLPGGSSDPLDLPDNRPVSVPMALNIGIKSIALVCGWVILFRMILEFLNRWLFWLFPDPIRIFLTGMLELSNGCLALSETESICLRFILAQLMLSLGGVCVWMQTCAVFPRLNLAGYLRGRALHCLICFLLSAPALSAIAGRKPLLTVLTCILASISVYFLTSVLRKEKKAVAFYPSMVYNEN